MIGIVGGSGFTRLASLEITHRQVVRTPYGEPSGALTFGRIADQSVVFLARHGYGHTIAPHEINYRANMWALHHEKVKRVVAIGAVGGIRADLAPATLVVPDQIIDYTQGRRNTYFEGADRPVFHMDFTHPYDQAVRAHLLQAARACGETVLDGGVYGCTEGPRLETLAEINRMERDGCDMVGMTGMPEAALARELGMGYAALAIVANWAAGRGDSAQAVELTDAHRLLEDAIPRVNTILHHLVTHHAD